MFLKKIELNNIRSYKHQTIEFDKGSVLLSGDIGCGKSSILLSIEFALFGIVKGDMSGNALLRNGETEGSVALTLELSNKEVLIKRILKRQKAGVSQISGYIIIDGVKTDLVATELKARILDLLGYSHELVNKSKSLIFRYTVYTPQEEMKKIIFSRSDERLDILRSVFGIDKYKLIRENLTDYQRELKTKIAYIEGQVQGLNKLESELTKSKEIKNKINGEIAVQKNKFDNFKLDLMGKRKKLEQYDEKSIVLNKIKNELMIYQGKLENVSLNQDSLVKRTLNLEKEIDDIRDYLSAQKKVKKELLIERIDLINNKISDEILNKDKITKTITEFEYRIKQSNTLKEKILNLNNCPTCNQDVSIDYKNLIAKENDMVIEDSNNKLISLKESLDKINQTINKLNDKLIEYHEIQKNLGVLALKQEILDKKISELIELKQKLDEFNLLKQEIKAKLIDYKNKIIILGYNLEEHNILKKQLADAENISKNQEIMLTTLITKKDSIDDIIKGLIDQIDFKINLQKKMLYLKNIEQYFSDFFENLMIIMEKNVMASIYHEFNELVRKWFTWLIGDESINVRLDIDFTPIVEQNGHEIELVNLSGGEKTSVALAYRLALNKVINNMISTITTNDLIILDEPTDGFSSDQLDRVKEVLDELSLKQILIVSHEPKMESYVDKSIRVIKQNHESSIIS